MQDQTHTDQAHRIEKISLFDKQRLAFYSPATEVLFGGAAGPGKSLLLRVSAIRWCEEVPGIQVYLFRRNFPDLMDNHLRGPMNFFSLLANKLSKNLVTYSQQRNEFVFSNGSRIRLCHCQNEDDVRKYQGAEIHVLMPDELTHFTEYQYRFLRGRVRCIGINIPDHYKNKLPRIECASNPGEIGHQWVKKAFVSGCEAMKIKKMPASEGGMLRQYIPALSKDNPRLLEDDPTYVDRLKGLGSEELVRAMLEGDWDIFAGQFFDSWRKDIHVLPADFKIEDHWTRFFGYDHGYIHPAFFGAFAVDEGGNIYLYKELGMVKMHVREIALAIRECLGKDTKYLNILHAGHDCFSKQRDGGPSIAEQFVTLPGDLRTVLIKANVDRVQGAAQVRNLLYHREEGGVRIGPKLYILENCVRTIDCIPAMIHDPNNPNDVKKVDATEADPWAGDDSYDMLRYGVMSRYNATKEIDKRFDYMNDETRAYWEGVERRKKELKDNTMGQLFGY